MNKHVEAGRYLKDCRKRLNLKQEEVSQKVGISRPSIGNIEEGRQGLTIENLISFSIVLKFHIPHFLNTVYDAKILTDVAKEKRIKALQFRKDKIDAELNKLLDQ